MSYETTLDEIERIITELTEENKTIPIVVEGEKDIAALHKLGINGVIIRINRGKSLIDFCDWLAEQYREIIILTDWDRWGGHLCRILMKNLEGRVKYYTSFRESLAKHATIRKVEGLPSWIETIKGKVNQGKEPSIVKEK